MTKGKIISLSIIGGIIILASILFGAVFCLRNQDVKVFGDSPINVSREELITTANLKNGKSIFMLDKELAIKNIESKFPYVKVIQIKTVNLTSIEICVRARHNTYYAKANDNFYILDEELKVLEIVPSTNELDLSSLTFLGNDCLKIPSSTLKCDFVGTAYQQKVLKDLFVSMSKVATKIEGEEKLYLTRSEICETIDSVGFETFESFNKIKIQTSYGVVLDLEKPESKLEEKINICFSTINKFIQDENGNEQGGVIKIYYNEKGEMQSIYVKE